MKILSKIQKDLKFDYYNRYQNGPTEDSFIIKSKPLSYFLLHKHKTCISLSINARINNQVNENFHKYTLVLNMPFFDNYGHCLHDVIPKLLWYDANSDADIIYTNGSDLMNSLLNLFEIKFKKIIFLEKDTKLNTEKIAIENHPAYHIRDKEKVRLLKNIINKQLPKLCDNKNKKSLIYCTRNTSSDTCHGRKMKQKNEEEIINLLKKYSKQENLHFVLFNGQEDGKTMSHLKQMQIFSNAEVVVGPHGSAMANVIYCNPKNNVKICEFCSGTEVQIHGGRFIKHYNFLNGNLLEEIYDYYLIPFTKDSTPEETGIDMGNLKSFLNYRT